MVDFESFSLRPKSSFQDLIAHNHRDDIQRIRNYSGQPFFRADYEKVRVVGKGAFGIAILYRRLTDGYLVVIKEVDVTFMNASERKLAINEVKVLSSLKHPNIVTFFNNYEWNGKLFIEMEYCSGGTLQDFLAQLCKLLKEIEILTIFGQIISAIVYIHDQNILHRDLKTANIFMTRENVFKIGDFGISKDLNTHRVGASTVVGTPHYISPEMCEGKTYDKKTDIWALGCILHETACLQKTFEGENLPALINKIIKGKYSPVNRKYSGRFQKLIDDMLQKDPCLRPHAHEIQMEVEELLVRNRFNLYENEKYSQEASTGAIMLAQQQLRSQSQQWRSLLFEVNLHKRNISLERVCFPFNERIRELAKSSDHFLALTQETRVYSWGNSQNGKLGLGPGLPDQISKPTLIEELSGKSVRRVLAGEGFSIFACRNGLVLSCGSAASNCLGHCGDNDVEVPSIINELLGYNVSDICCGPQHAIAITEDGEALGWGDNFYGQLGLIDDPISTKVPRLIRFPNYVFIKRAFTGVDATMFIDDRDRLWACGSNENNKLGLCSNMLFRKISFCRIYEPKRVRCWKRQRIRSISLGTASTSILMDDCSLVVLGSCEVSDLSSSSSLLRCCRPSFAFYPRLCENSVTKIQQGNNFILAQTYENQIYFWGIREIYDHRQDEQSVRNEDETLLIGPTNNALMDMVQNSGPDHPILLVSDPKVIIKRSRHLSLLSLSPDSIRRDYILKSQPILALYSSHANLRFGDDIEISDIYCFADQRVFLLIDTTIQPPPQDKPKPNRQRSRNAVQRQMSQLPVVLEEASINTSIPENEELSRGKADGNILRWTSKNSDPMRLFNWTYPLRPFEREVKLKNYPEERNVQLSHQLEESRRRVEQLQNKIIELEEKLSKSKRDGQNLQLCNLQ
ncbi:nimA-like kinase isoform X2 [Brevipalpus obovatus]|uniref:nimA-like kinase isoform X2 n=2 Tax=Brevipalpus obovatus TaxID=246614 RepID=UPI003D9F9500